MFTRLDYSSALEYSIIMRYTNIIYIYIYIYIYITIILVTNVLYYYTVPFRILVNIIVILIIPL